MNCQPGNNSDTWWHCEIRCSESTRQPLPRCRLTCLQNHRVQRAKNSMSQNTGHLGFWKPTKRSHELSKGRKEKWGTATFLLLWLLSVSKWHHKEASPRIQLRGSCCGGHTPPAPTSSCLRHGGGVLILASQLWQCLLRLSLPTHHRPDSGSGRHSSNTVEVRRPGLPPAFLLFLRVWKVLICVLNTFVFQTPLVGCVS